MDTFLHWVYFFFVRSDRPIIRRYYYCCAALLSQAFDLGTTIASFDHGMRPGVLFGRESVKDNMCLGVTVDCAAALVHLNRY